MSNDDAQLLSLLSRLIEVELDITEAYQAAVERVSNAGARRTLSAFLEDHERHIEELSLLTTSLGGKPPDQGELKRLLTLGKVVFGKVAGDAGVLAAMRSNEDGTNEAYEEALTQGKLPPEVRKLLRAHLSDERRHRGWVEGQADAARPSSWPPPAYESF
jgi:uncharacterized protein (TIGR02284 family)